MKHHCHALQCKRQCTPAMLMCKPCWALVTPETQADVYRTVKLRNGACDASWAPWWRASHTAMFEVAQKTPERFAEGWDPKPWLARQMSVASEMERDKGTP